MRLELVIDRLGHDGDGLATTPDGDLAVVRGALPGERVIASGIPGRPLETEAILEASPDRVPPPCIHFPVCGGCTLQHLRPEAAQAHKEATVAAALSGAGFADVALLPTVVSGLRTRRRMDLAFARDGRDIRVGLHVRGSGTVVDLVECYILEPGLFALLAPLRTLLPRLALTGNGGSIVVNGLDDGPDLLLRSTVAPSTSDRALVAAFADSQGIPRISWQHEDVRKRAAPEPLATRQTPRIRLGTTDVAPAPGAFLQATRGGEVAIVADVLAGLEGLGRTSRVVELYAGIGTITLAIAAIAKVRAVEGDMAAIAALARAAGGMRVEALHRDLARAPMAASELAGVDAVVLDPPFRGAGAQIETIAAAAPSVVVIVSCNPGALRREAAILREAGYALAQARAIDQFPFSGHVESVSVFRRGSSRRSRSGPSRSGS